GYRPDYLDLLCLGGQITWVAGPRRAADEEVPSRVAFVPRERGFLARRHASEAEPEEAKEQTVLKALREGGALYLDQIAQRAGLSDRDVLRALWSLAADGWATNDGFAPLRLLAGAPTAAAAIAAPPERKSSRYDAGLRARLKSSLGGRWVAIGGNADANHDAQTGTDSEREFAMALPRRHGILTAELLAGEEGVTWSDLVFALRRVEYGGTIRRGYFVRSLSGEQYALPEAVEMLRAIRTTPPPEHIAALCAVDPA